MASFLPLKKIKKIAQTYRKCWDAIEDLHFGKAQSEFVWEDLCYIPISSTLTITDPAESGAQGPLNDATIMAALAAWRQDKRIYRFPKELEAVLFAQSEWTDVPVQVLNDLPATCLYIETLGPAHDRKQRMQGFFVHLDSKPEYLDLCLTILHKDLTVHPLTVHLLTGRYINSGISVSQTQS